MADDVVKDLPELSAEAKKILEAVEKMSVLELANLVKHMEEKFGVSAAAPVAMAAAPAAGAGDAAEEKTIFNVKLVDAGANKIAVIKVVKDITGLGLMEAKKAVEENGVVKENAPKEEAEEIKKKLEEAGAKVELA